MLDLILCAIISFTLTYLIVHIYFKGNDGFWPSRGVQLLTLRDVTTFSEFYFGAKSTVLELDTALYTNLKNKGLRFGGLMELRTPVLLVADLDLAKRIMVKDFEYFVNRRDVRVRTTDPLTCKILVNLNNQEWKDGRHALTPIFSTSKIRSMYSSFVYCAEKLGKFIEQRTGTTIAIHEASTRYVVDVIVSTAFGVEPNCLEDKDSLFYKMARQSQEQTPIVALKSWLLVNFPRIAKLLRLTFGEIEAHNFFANLLKKVYQNRKSYKTSRQDFLELMIEAKEKKLNNVEFSDDFIHAQSFSFLFSGFVGPSSLLSFCCWRLALHPQIQEQLRDEIDTALKPNGGQLTYDAIVNDMPFMEAFLSEVLRMHPPGPRAERLCTKDYILPDTDITIPKGTLVSIPIFALQNDERYVESANTFDPTRFTAQKSPINLLSFGQGPRSCIGARFATIEVKVALACLFQRFTVKSAIEEGMTDIKTLRPENLLLTFSRRL